ncbi:MAG TPA: hypothetical protein VNP04_18325 [Alphaproteobacteria bacterium]|nr:hypothetical protein [Alphaproteobacteria bacterium]
MQPSPTARRYASRDANAIVAIEAEEQYRILQTLNPAMAATLLEFMRKGPRGRSPMVAITSHLLRLGLP